MNWWWMIPDDLIITRKSNKRPIYRVIAGPTYNGPTYNEKGQAQRFRSRSLLSQPSLSSKCVTKQFRMALARRPKNWAWACLHRLLTRQTRIAIVLILSLVHGVILSSVHETTLFAVRIEPTKAVNSLQVNIKPRKPSTSTFRAHQEVYRVFQDYQEAAAHLTAW